MISKYGIKVKNVVKDFTFGPNDPINFYQDIYLQTKDLDISIVINNVGVATTDFLFADTPLKMILNQVALNIFPICFISRLFLPKMLNRSQGGAIINLSSVSRFLNNQTVVQYCACKAFDYVLSDTLSSEVSITRSQGKIDVLCLQPAMVNTPLTSTMGKKPLTISRYECAEAALKCLGNLNETSGHWKHLIIWSISSIIPYIE